MAGCSSSARADGHQLMRADRRGEHGQVVVVFALALVVLLGAAGLAFDVGRFYSERRFLQNSADAGALAAANALIRGGTVAEADADARTVLARNFLSSPSGSRRPSRRRRPSTRAPCGDPDT